MSTKQHNNARIAQSLRAMGRLLLMTLFLMLGVGAMAQQKILLHPNGNSSKCEKSDMTSLRATFSFPELEAQDYKNKAGEFSLLSMPNTVIGGNEGDPEIPVVNELIAVPIGATPRIKVKNFRTEDYNLSDYDIKTLAPRQPSVRKDKSADDVPFVYNKEAYEKEGLSTEPKAVVEVVGTMRGVRLAKMTIEPVSYDPVKNAVRVFNDIEVEVTFDGADAQATKDMLKKTYSPYFDVVYKQLFNGNATKDAYSDHPDLYNTPVRMLVICYSGFKNNSALDEWLQWKLQKGYDVDIYYTNETGTTSSAIASFIKTKYNASVSAGNAYTYLIVIGDTGQVPAYMTKTIDSDIGQCASDLGYASVNFSSSTSNYFPDMFYSRISVENTTHLTNYLNKVLTYEKYNFTDGGNYLNNVLLVGGWDSNWTSRVAKPTINYATNYYFNSSNTTYGGFSGGTIRATISTSSSAGYSGTNNGVYNGINDGACLVNYTAHGDKQEWQVPQFTAAQVATLSNTGKYFFGVGNCCLTGNFNNTTTTYSPGSSIGANACFAETMIRVPNAGAVAYIGCSPYSYWYEDFYWAVGAHSYSQGNYPTQSASSKGVYDVMFEDQNWNSASALLYVGNLAVQQSVTNGNTNSSVTDGDCNNSAHYYFQFYHTFGDGSVMPYITKPETNNVSHASTIRVGATTFTVAADADSYVSITKNNEILGVAVVPSTGSVDVPITGLNDESEVMVVVTRQQRQPYITTIQAIAPNGPHLSLDSYTPTMAYVGESTNLSLTFKNMGNAATTGTTMVTLSSDNPNVTINGSGSFGALNTGATTTVSSFSFTLGSGVTLGSPVTLHYSAVNGSNTWEGDFTITPNQIFAVSVASNNSSYGTVSGGGSLEYGSSCTVTATPADGYMFTGWTQNGNVVSTNPEYTFNVTSDMNLVANFAVGVMIGDGGTSTNDYLPSYNYYNYSLSEQIYTSAELGGAGIITSIAFYNGGAAKTRTLDFYLKATTKSSFSGNTDWIAVSAGDKVFSGSVTMVADGWTTITFTTPFVYDGTSNVVLVADDNSGEWTNSPHMSCRVFSTSSNQALYYYNDNTNFNPLSPPTSSNSTYNKVLSVKNQLIVTKEEVASPWPVPTDLSVSNITSNSAVVSWQGEADSYELQYVEDQMETITYDFEDGWQGWTTFKGTEGTSTHSWMHNTEYVAYDSNGNQIVPECHNSSDGMMLSESYISAATSGGSGTAVTPDNYLVSPRIPLGGSFTFYAASRMSNYPEEKFSVLVSESGNSRISDFTHTELTVTLDDNVWREYTVDLSAYSGMGYVAIRHYDCNDQHLLYIDDVTIVGKESNWITVTDATSPCTLTGLTPNTQYVTRVRALHGEEGESGWSDNVSFTTKDYVTIELANDADNTDVIEANNGNDATVTLTGRTLYKDDAWNTLCLPFDVTVSESPLADATIMEFDTSTSVMNDSKLTLNFTNVTDIVAGKPYLIKWENGENIVNPVFTGVTINKNLAPAEIANTITFTGNYAPVTFNAGDESILYLGSNNQLYYPSASFAFNAFRAYFQLAEGMKRIKGFVLNLDDDATGIIGIGQSTEDTIYNVAGQRLNKVQKGVNIVNGKKVMVK